MSKPAVHIPKWIIALIIVLGLAGAATAQETCIATGDANCSGSVTIGDISRLIELFAITGGELVCPYEVDVNGDCVVDRTDLNLLIDCMNTPWPGECFATPTCCDPVVKPCCLGDPNRSGGEPTIGDVTAIINAIFITGSCYAICTYGADINQSGGGDPTCDDITISDVTMLIDCLFITGDPSACSEPCPEIELSALRSLGLESSIR